MLRRPALAFAMGLTVMFALAQLKPVQLTNPPSTGDLSAPGEIDATLRRACYDCHSNRTRWPWYSRVAPVSWMVVHDVDLGRKELNFSEWDGYFPRTRKHKLEWMQRALRDQIMPPWSYRLMHPEARLSDADRARLQLWIAAELAGPAPAQPVK